MDVLDERHYAWRMLRAARRAQASLGSGIEQMSTSIRDEIQTLLTEAMEAGLDRATLVTELAALGGRLLTFCDPTPEQDPGEDPGSLPDLAGQLAGLVGESPAH
ncbi:MAG TPA: hypothetical protein PLK19_09565 [Mycobacterium sp.]|nr:hypothetical protein [Mycobacterium sp.]